MSDWVGHAQRELEREGYRLSGPRSAVVETLADLGCSVTAKEIADSLHRRGEDVGVASIYRTLELLDKLRLTRRVDAAEGVARYEPVAPRASTTITSSARAAARSRPSRTPTWSARSSGSPAAWTTRSTGTT